MINAQKNLEKVKKRWVAYKQLIWKLELNLLESLFDAIFILCVLKSFKWMLLIESSFLV